MPSARQPALCAVQVRVGSENAMAQRILRVARDAALDAFALRRDLMRREAGEWRVRRDVLFPGYVIVETRDPELLEKRLQLLTETSHLLRGAGDAIAQLDEREAALVRTLGNSAHVVGISQGEIVSNRLFVSSGPLRGLESLVRNIDRHKRIAYLDAAAFGCLAAGEGRRPGRRASAAKEQSTSAEPRPVRVALEVVRKV